jgi:hypothetical protein
VVESKQIYCANCKAPIWVSKGFWDWVINRIILGKSLCKSCKAEKDERDKLEAERREELRRAKREAYEIERAKQQAIQDVKDERENTIRGLTGEGNPNREWIKKRGKDRIL